MSKFEIRITLEPENPDGDKTMIIEPTENYNYVAIRIGGSWYDVAIEDLYRATLPFMDMRHEERSREV